MKKKLVKVDKQENKGGRTQKQHGSQHKRVILGVKFSTLLCFGLTTKKMLQKYDNHGQINFNLISLRASKEALFSNI